MFAGARPTAASRAARRQAPALLERDVGRALDEVRAEAVRDARQRAHAARTQRGSPLDRAVPLAGVASTAPMRVHRQAVAQLRATSDAQAIGVDVEPVLVAQHAPAGVGRAQVHVRPARSSTSTSRSPYAAPEPPRHADDERGASSPGTAGSRDSSARRRSRARRRTRRSRAARTGRRARRPPRRGTRTTSPLNGRRAPRRSGGTPRTRAGTREPATRCPRAATRRTRAQPRAERARAATAGRAGTTLPRRCPRRARTRGPGQSLPRESWHRALEHEHRQRTRERAEHQPVDGAFERDTSATRHPRQIAAQDRQRRDEHRERHDRARDDQRVRPEPRSVVGTKRLRAVALVGQPASGAAARRRATAAAPRTGRPPGRATRRGSRTARAARARGAQRSRDVRPR